MAASTLGPIEPAIGPSLREVADRYLERGQKGWTAKTFASRKARLGYLIEYLGADTLIRSVSSDHLRDFADAVCRLRNNRGRAVGASFASRQTDNLEHRITPKTATLIFETAKAFFRWAKSKQGFIKSNPAEDVVIEVPKIKKSAKSRRPFSPEELTKIFSAPVFAGRAPGNRRHDRGNHIVRDAYFWIPLIGFYTGARLGEIVQIHLDDVKLDGDIPYLTITDENGGQAGEDDAKSVKSIAGVRNVPIHPELMGLGFGAFVASRRNVKRTSRRLFFEISFGADTQASAVFSKWFARFLDRIGSSDPALVFHSFRHNAEDSFRNALLPQSVIDRIIGHSDGAISSGYGEGVWIETAYTAVKVMKLRVDVASLIKTE